MGLQLERAVLKCVNVVCGSLCTCAALAPFLQRLCGMRSRRRAPREPGGRHHRAPCVCAVEASKVAGVRVNGWTLLADEHQPIVACGHQLHG